MLSDYSSCFTNKICIGSTSVWIIGRTALAHKLRYVVKNARTHSIYAAGR